jgi:type VI protein secretion system component VasF
MNKIEEHVDRLLRDIPAGERKAQLKQDFVQDLEEMVSDLMENGKSEEDAVNKAIVDFGDIDDLKAELVPPVKVRKRHGLGLAFSVVGSLLIILLVLFVNFYYTPRVIWCVYPIFAVLWWPLAMLFAYLRNR